mmetsp:Transcript_19410/g.47952  ORF Transcript_19410/g.47952 Transcript_19410/m.47952 type:complete len:106 (-) Transcript_19410:1362-1679(-)
MSAMLPSTVVMFEQSPSIRISQGLLMLNLLEASSELSHQIKKKIIPGVLLNVLEVEIYQPFPPAGVVYDVTVFSFRQKKVACAAASPYREDDTKHSKYPRPFFSQ